MTDTTRIALEKALTEAYKQGYREGGHDALAAAATAFKAAYPEAADTLRTMQTLSADLMPDD